MRDRLERHEKIMGFGHAVYRTMDPRATVLKDLAREVGARHGDERWADIFEALQETVYEQKQLWPNVDLYAAGVYHSLGIPTDLMTPLFALARMAGWTAHVREQYADNKVIRPGSTYVGPARPGLGADRGTQLAVFPVGDAPRRGALDDARARLHVGRGLVELRRLQVAERRRDLGACFLQLARNLGEALGERSRVVGRESSMSASASSNAVTTCSKAPVNAVRTSSPFSTSGVPSAATSSISAWVRSESSATNVESVSFASSGEGDPLVNASWNSVLCVSRSVWKSPIAVHSPSA